MAFSSNIYVYRDAYLALKSKGNVIIPLFVPFVPVYIAVTYLGSCKGETKGLPCSGAMGKYGGK